MLEKAKRRTSEDGARELRKAAGDRFGSPSGASCNPYGALWGPLEGLGSLLEASWSLLEASWSLLGLIWKLWKAPRQSFW